MNDDARYIILPGDLRKDARLTLGHIKVAMVLGAYSKRHGWTDLTQNDVGEMANLSRQTVCELVGELVEWGWVARRKKDKKNQYVYRFIMDREDYCQPQPTVPSEYCQPQPTGTVGSDPTFNKERTSTLSQSTLTAPLPPQQAEAPSSGQSSKVDLKGSGIVRPRIYITAEFPSWPHWLDRIERDRGPEARRAVELLGRLEVAARWPTDDTPTPVVTIIRNPSGADA